MPPATRKISVICCIYNALPLVRKCLDALLATAPADCEVILVDNHSPDEAARQFIRDILPKDPRVAVFDPGSNLGCHRGWNYGYHHSTGEFVCKLDDDTVIQTQGWAEKLIRVFQVWPDLAAASSDIDAKQANKYVKAERDGCVLEIATQGVVGFSFVMFRRADIQRWGPMRTGQYRTAVGSQVKEDRLYGGEEVFIAQCAAAEKKIIAHVPAVFCHHLGNEERHQDFAFWKRVYGYYAWTSLPMEEWIRAGDHLKDYARAIILEAGQLKPNDVLLAEWAKRLGEIGYKECIPILSWLFEFNQNEVVRANIKAAVNAINFRNE